MITIFCDGLTEPRNPDGYGCCAFVAFDGDVSGTRGAQRPAPLHQAYACIARPGDGITNNICEYRAVRAALKWAVAAIPNEEIIVKTDSQLVVRQVNGDWACNKDHLRVLRDECRALLQRVNARLVWVARDQNDVADALTRVAYAEARKARAA